MVRPYFQRLATRDLDQELTITCNREKKGLKRIAWFSIWCACVPPTHCRWSEFGDLESLRKAENVSFYHVTNSSLSSSVDYIDRKISRLLSFQVHPWGLFCIKDCFYQLISYIKIVNWRLPSTAKQTLILSINSEKERFGLIWIVSFL